MSNITLAAGVPEGTLASVLHADTNLTIEDLENRLEFLNEVRWAEYQRVVEIWRLLPPDIWQRYADFGETQLREQKLLKAARKELRRVWRKKYGEKEPIPVESLDSGSAA